MHQDLPSVKVQQSASGSWEAIHEPSGKAVVGISEAEVVSSMRQLLGLSEQGAFSEPLTSGRFQGISQAIALFLEGPISEALSFHSGWARLEAFEEGIAHIRLGGGCQGCPSSQITLFNGVKTQLQSRFGEEVVEDILPYVN